MFEQTNLLSAAETEKRMNLKSLKQEPFIFIIDFDQLQNVVLPIQEAATHGIFFEINRGNKILKNHVAEHSTQQTLHFQKEPVSFEVYQESFEKIKEGIQYGDSFLANLTFETPIKLNLSLKAIFEQANSPFKLLFKDDFCCFSPEIFVNVIDGIITSHPMKGTISANVADAAQVILNDPKEKAEHATIVDLIRNDLSMVANKVWVNKYRYISEVDTQLGKLLQVSSEICGKLPDDYLKNLGSIMFKLLPAGSVTGAPKSKTLALINQAETHKRGYYTGVFGVFDGQNLYSSVMIRFIEKRGDDFFFKSGGGITSQSKAKDEYEEMIEKVYLTGKGL